MIQLFVELFRGQLFHFGDKPDRRLIKSDDSHFVSPTGTLRKISPYVAVIPEEPKEKNSKPLFTGKKEE